MGTLTSSEFNRLVLILLLGRMKIIPKMNEQFYQGYRSSQKSTPNSDFGLFVVDPTF
ncbi:hypothetical protein LEP1GSC132_3384 [Leptospira kirschneri str. 200803703]|uniref:Uncharacterized protein n=1 Tax=Leptospira kirschneri str. 200802841 TaxID=1193047 RepID=A0A828XZJ6_9LEPT|nr:hypothetical protein LEP1GSC044_1667 [Leptospira kirschneri serovar Grippotyphosa str. RM52]EKO50645.1 hypothetical protein LEP1GSC131_0752 [Leptospira kirschneri str. 200802841]EMN24898.1 hypothetical protein LEP1GSC065_3365 [Leptospira kirschneri serovar Sokoine str. RM1]EMO67504.1 hypothetical protein LEP1GSC132_3384 [Leptospira kirschneri str. 200803703]EMO76888.1 hypothetical protein LEP1GSC127_3889 [Leptospira kirschneri str. 200801925]